MFQLSAFLSSIIFWGWLSFIVAVVIFLKMIAKLPEFLREYRAQKVEDKKQIDSYVQLLAKFNQSTDEQFDISQKYGINSPELTAAKEKSMAIFGEMQKMGIQ